MEQIFIERLKVFGRHGVYQKEKEDGQIFLVDCVCDVSFAEAIDSDQLSHTTDYGNLCLFIRKFFAEHAFDLIEKAADELAHAILYAFPGILGLRLTINKPQAPIPMEFEGVGIRLSKQWTKTAISMGSNMGNREEYLTQAMEKLIAHPAIRNLVVSDYIETEPYGYHDQDMFLNGAATFETLLAPEQLLDLLHEMEQEAGRERKIHWGPRTLDLDILLYGDLQVDRKGLIIPHMDMCNRRFVLEPLAKIAPGMIHPVRRRSVYDLYRQLLPSDQQPS